MCGIQDERLQRRLLAEPDLTFKKAFDIAQAYESAESNAKALRTSQPAEVHATKMSDRSGASFQDTPCYRCGGRHRAADCRFRDAICNHCSKKGHIARACRSRNRSAKHQPLQSGKPLRSKPQRANCLTQEAEEAEEEPHTPLSVEYSMFQVSVDRVPYSGKFSHGANFRIFRMKFSYAKI